MFPNEKTIDVFSNLIRDSQDKFKKSNLKQTLATIMEIIKGIIKSFDRSKVLDDCSSLLDGYKNKVEKVNQARKKIKQGDRQCMEVLRQKKEIEDTITDISKDRQLIELASEELKQINSSDFTLNLGD